MNLKNLKFGSIFFFLICLTACGFQKSSNKNGENFDSFYTKFHKDSSFQIERTTFPLNGQTSYLEPTGSRPTYFYADDWRMHQPMIDTMDLEQNIIDVDTIMVDVIFDSHAVGLTRYFSLRDGKWYLTYYSEHNPIDPNFVDIKKKK